MVRVERLVPVAEPIETPRCEAVRETPYANDKADTNFQCKWSSRFKIEGKHLCSKHAAKRALEILLKDHPNE